MSTQISDFKDVSSLGVDFETGTICGSVAIGERNGTRKMFTITPHQPQANAVSAQVVMPKFQALLVASQIAHQFGYKLQKVENDESL